MMVRIAIFLLLMAPSFQDVEALIERLSSDDIAVRDLAEAALVKVGERARPALEKSLSHANPEVRSRAASILKKLDVAVRAAKLLDVCGVIEGTRVVWVVRDGFEMIKDREAWSPELKRVMDGKLSAYVALAGFEDAFGELAYVSFGTNGLDVLHPIVDDGIADVFMVRQHPFVDDAMVGEHGIAALWRWKRLPRHSIAFVGVGIVRGAFFAALGKALGHARPAVRTGAVIALQNLRTPANVATLLALAEDPEVTRAVEKVVRIVADAPAGTAKELRAWWDVLSVAGRAERVAAQYKGTMKIVDDMKQLDCCPPSDR